MGRLHQVKLILVLFAGLSRIVPAQDDCSLIVRALSPTGERMEVPIWVIEQSGRIQTKYQEPGEGDVQFCDLGILPVKVKLGSAGLCNQVTVDHVPIELGETYLLVVTYDGGACRERVPPPVPICKVLFRVSDSKKRWVPHAEVVIENAKRRSRYTDRFGRALYVATAGEKLRGTVSATGYRTSHYEWTCSVANSQHEEQITLENE